MNTAKAEIVNQPVVRLTAELSPTHAAELAELLACHVNFRNSPWAESIYNALRRVSATNEQTGVTYANPLPRLIR